MSNLSPVVYLFPETSRAATPSAPPYDPTRKVKSWVDPNPGAGPTVTYQVLDGNGNVISLTLSIAEASTLNLPGHPDYPPYAPAPTKSAFTGGSPLPYGVVSLSDAQALAVALGEPATAVFDELTSFPIAALNYDPTDPRRCYGFVASGVAYDCSQLLAQQNALGVGNPGKWVQASSVTWSWLSELAPDPTNPVVEPQPLAPLGPNQSYIVGPFGVEVETNDPTPAPASGDNFNAATDPTMQAILAGVNAIRGLLHV